MMSSILDVFTLSQVHYWYAVLLYTCTCDISASTHNNEYVYALRVHKDVKLISCDLENSIVLCLYYMYICILYTCRLSTCTFPCIQEKSWNGKWKCDFVILLEFGISDLMEVCSHYLKFRKMSKWINCDLKICGALMTKSSKSSTWMFIFLPQALEDVNMHHDLANLLKNLCFCVVKIKYVLESRNMSKCDLANWWKTVCFCVMMSSH